MVSVEIPEFWLHFKEEIVPFHLYLQVDHLFMSKNILSHPFIIQILLHFNKSHIRVIIDRT